MSTLPIIFEDNTQLMSFAEDFIVRDRLASLENDVNRCVPNLQDITESAGYAPFPAIMYCFSIIDLLGSLYAGNARGGKTTDNSAKYMEKYLKYPKDKAQFLQRIYRHKIIHLSQPKPAVLYNKQIIAWRHTENEPSKHLTIDPTTGNVDLPSRLGRIHCDAQYIVSIRVLKDDIKNSVIHPEDGYLKDLRDNPDLQNKFVTAINQIYDPVITD